jgi:hypothetical protein
MPLQIAELPMLASLRRYVLLSCCGCRGLGRYVPLLVVELPRLAGLVLMPPLRPLRVAKLPRLRPRLVACWRVLDLLIARCYATDAYAARLDYPKASGAGGWRGWMAHGVLHAVP